jgi:hypothetical protein
MGVLGQSRDQGAASVAPPALGPVDRTGFFANVGAGFRQAVAGPHSTRVGDAIAEKKLYDQVITALAQEGEQGEDTLTITAQPTKVKRSFRNPYVSQPWENLLNPSYNPITSLYGGGDAGEKQQIWEAVARVRARKPDFLKGFADEGALSAYALQQRQKQIAAAGAVTERAGTLGTVGAFVGGAGGSVASLDPENVVGGGFGSAAGKTFARTVIRRATEGAAVNAAAAVVGLPGQAADANHLGQEMTPGDMAHQVGEAALIGGALGGAPHLVPKVAGTAKAAVALLQGRLPRTCRQASETRLSRLQSGRERSRTATSFTSTSVSTIHMVRWIRPPPTRRQRHTLSLATSTTARPHPFIPKRWRIMRTGCRRWPTVSGLL